MSSHNQKKPREPFRAIADKFGDAFALDDYITVPYETLSPVLAHLKFHGHKALFVYSMLSLPRDGTVVRAGYARLAERAAMSRSQAVATMRFFLDTGRVRLVHEGTPGAGDCNQYDVGPLLDLLARTRVELGLRAREERRQEANGAGDDTAALKPEPAAHPEPRPLTTRTQEIAFDFKALWDLMPKRADVNEGQRTWGITQCKKYIKTQEQYDNLRRRIGAYPAHLEARHPDESARKRYADAFGTFVEKVAQGRYQFQEDGQLIDTAQPAMSRSNKESTDVASPTPEPTVRSLCQRFLDTHPHPTSRDDGRGLAMIAMVGRGGFGGCVTTVRLAEHLLKCLDGYIRGRGQTTSPAMRPDDFVERWASGRHGIAADGHFHQTRCPKPADYLSKIDQYKEAAASFPKTARTVEVFLDDLQNAGLGRLQRPWVPERYDSEGAKERRRVAWARGEAQKREWLRAYLCQDHDLRPPLPDLARLAKEFLERTEPAARVVEGMKEMLAADARQVPPNDALFEASENAMRESVTEGVVPDVDAMGRAALLALHPMEAA